MRQFLIIQLSSREYGLHSCIDYTNPERGRSFRVLFGT